MPETTRPLVFVALLVKQKEALLEAWLKSLSEWDYPKDRVVLYVRSNNNTDRTEEILREWVELVRGEYFDVIEDYSDVLVEVERFGVHEWNAERFSVLGQIRNESVRVAGEIGADYYFVCDVDNFLLPGTLSALVEAAGGLGRAVVSPMLKNAWVESEGKAGVGGSIGYSNFHNVVDSNGYFAESSEYWVIWGRRVRGLLDIDLVHCTYLIPRSVFGDVQYVDGSGRHEYVVFSEGLRRRGVRQILDNRVAYGVLTLTENLSAVEEYLTDGSKL